MSTLTGVVEALEYYNGYPYSRVEEALARVKILLDRSKLLTEQWQRLATTPTKSLSAQLVRPFLERSFVFHNDITELRDCFEPLFQLLSRIPLSSLVDRSPEVGEQEHKKNPLADEFTLAQLKEVRDLFGGDDLRGDLLRRGPLVIRFPREVFQLPPVLQPPSVVSTRPVDWAPRVRGSSSLEYAEPSGTTSTGKTRKTQGGGCRPCLTAETRKIPGTLLPSLVNRSPDELLKEVPHRELFRGDLRGRDLRGVAGYLPVVFEERVEFEEEDEIARLMSFADSFLTMVTTAMRAKICATTITGASIEWWMNDSEWLACFSEEDFREKQLPTVVQQKLRKMCEPYQNAMLTVAREWIDAKIDPTDLAAISVVMKEKWCELITRSAEPRWTDYEGKELRCEFEFYFEGLGSQRGGGVLLPVPTRRSKEKDLALCLKVDLPVGESPGARRPPMVVKLATRSFVDGAWSFRRSVAAAHAAVAVGNTGVVTLIGVRGAAGWDSRGVGFPWDYRPRYYYELYTRTYAEAELLAAYGSSFGKGQMGENLSKILHWSIFDRFVWSNSTQTP